MSYNKQAYGNLRLYKKKFWNIIMPDKIKF